MLDELKEDICNLINNSNLPIDAIYYVMKDIFTEVDLLHNSYIEQKKNIDKAKDKLEEEKDKKGQS